jgi:pyridoxine 4-dehydrogenase
VLKAAIATGVNVWNAADFYGTPENHSLHLMNRYFTANPEDADKVVLCIKTGLIDLSPVKMDCSAVGLRGFLDNALRILDGKKNIDIFGCARIDPAIPVEESVRALAQFREEGLIGGIQLTEVGPDTIQRAVAVTKIDMVEAEISLWATDVFQNGVVEVCAQHDIVLEAHTPLGAGMLTGNIKSLDDLPENDHHRMFPRWQPDTFAKNRLLVDEIEKLAKQKGCTTPQLALSWIKTKSKLPGMPVIVPIPGARSVERLIENSQETPLASIELEAIDTVLKQFPVAGARFPPAAQAFNEY